MAESKRTDLKKFVLGSQESPALEEPPVHVESQPSSYSENLQARNLSSSDEGMVTITVRLKPRIVTAIRRASMERKITRRQPYTQQEIMETALSEWLRINGVSL